jgi:hypothetical protein
VGTSPFTNLYGQRIASSYPPRKYARKENLATYCKENNNSSKEKE